MIASPLYVNILYIHTFGAKLNHIYIYVFQVAGVIAASGNNGQGITGVAWSGMKLIGCRAANVFDTVTCVDFCHQRGAKIIQDSNNMAPGAPFSHLMYEKYIEFGKNGGLIFVPAGNDNENMLGFDSRNFDAAKMREFDVFPGPQAAGYAQTPLGMESIINVAAMAKRGDKILPASYTGYGAPYVDLFAPGGDVDQLYKDTKLTKADGYYASKDNLLLLLKPNSRYVGGIGSSFASPHVAGAADLVWAEYPQLINFQVKEILCSTAWTRSEKLNEFQKLSTYGVLNVAAAIARAREIKFLQNAFDPISPPPGAKLITG
jgi:subtilisin family serine protease